MIWIRGCVHQSILSEDGRECFYAQVEPPRFLETNLVSMQEEVLSRRVFCFINDQLYYRCEVDAYSEAMNAPGLPVVDFNYGASLFSSLLKGSIDFGDVATLLMYYGSRKLSFESDTLRAALGMLQRYSKLSETLLVEGLTAPFEQSLLFLRYLGATQHVAVKPQREQFPSYSWTGWRQVIHWDISVENASVHQHVDYDRLASVEPKLSGAHLRAWIVWYTIENKNYVSIDMLGNKIVSRRPAVSDSVSRAPSEFQYYSQVDSEADPRSIALGKPFPVLLFWTVCINLTIKRTSEIVNDDQRRWIGVNGQREYNYETFDRLGRPCGEVTLDARQFEDSRVGKFALIARDGNNYWALLLSWDEDGLAERWGIGQLNSECLAACLEPGPRWKEIILG
jgi:hypothetical protein